MTNRIFLALCSALLTISNFASAQEQLGLRLSNYSGINGVLFNPAANVSSPLKWDVNLIAAGAFAENNYIFIKDANLFKVIRNRDGYTFAGDQANAETLANPSGLQYDFTTGKRRKEGYVNVFLTGPSAMFRVKEHTFGVFFNARSITSTNRVPSSLGYYDVQGLEDGDVIQVKKFKAATMSWSEIGLNYGRSVFRQSKYVVDAGVSLKFLQGYEAAFFQNKQSTTIVLQQDYMTYNGAEVRYGVASGLTGYGNGNSYSFKPRGYGASLDVGAVLFIRSKDKEKGYDWKIGLSMVDFGKIFFRKDAQLHVINTDNIFDFVQGDYSGYNDFNDYFQTLSLQSLANNEASLQAHHFSMWTPGAIAVSAEYAFTNNIFVNASAVRRLRFFGPVPERDNIWAVTPRYERRWFEASLPVVLFNDKDLRLGTAVRLGPLVIGTDNVTSWIGSQKFSGSDIYFALKINPFTIHKSPKEPKNRLMNPNDCFYF